MLVSVEKLLLHRLSRL